MSQTTNYPYSNFQEVKETVLRVPGATEDGINWLILATDPNHDFQRALGKFPGVGGMASYIVKEKYTVTCSKPSGLGTSSSWDLHACTMPELMTHEGTLFRAGYNLATDTFTTTDAATEGHLPLAPLIYDSCAAGTNTFEVATTPPLATNRAFGCLPTNRVALSDRNSAFNNSAVRLLSQAIECVDTTSELYKQGKLCSYRLPQTNVLAYPTNGVHSTATASPQTSTVCGAKISVSSLAKKYEVLADDSDNELKDGPVRETFITTFYPATLTSILPPTNFEAATKIPNSKIWDAKQGCYSVSAMTSEDNPFITPLSASRVLWNGISGNNYTSLSTIDTLISTSITGVDGTGNSELWLPAPFDTVGVYFSGLNPQSTIAVTLTRYYEIAPLCVSNNITLATPAADYDPIAIGAYQKVVKRMPSGVPANMNAFGDFFKMIKNVVSKAAPVVQKISSAIAPIPVIGNIASAANSGLQMANKVMSVVPVSQPRARAQVVQQPIVMSAPAQKRKPKQRTTQRLVQMVSQRRRRR